MSRCRWLCSRNWSRPGSGRTRGRAAERRDTDAVPRVLDELFEASHFGLVAFGAHHPVRSRHSIRRSLCLEKFPGSLVLAERSLALRGGGPRAQLGGRREELHVLGRGHVATIYTWPTSPTGRATTTRWPARASTGWPVSRTAFLPSA